MGLFEDDQAAGGLLPPSCVEHFKRKGKRPICPGCGKPLGVERSPVPGLGAWFCSAWCRTTAEKGSGALDFADDETPTRTPAGWDHV